MISFFEGSLPLIASIVREICVLADLQMETVSVQLLETALMMLESLDVLLLILEQWLT